MTEHADDGRRADGHQRADDREHATPGPLAEEALRFVNSVQDWVGREWPVEQAAAHPRECQWCPLCQFVAMLRGERPELSARVSEAGAALLAAMRAVLDAAADAGTTANTPQRRRGTPDSPRVQRIDLSGG
jgi:hypothetical protein